MDIWKLQLLITPKGNIHKRPIITYRGLPVSDTDEFIYAIEDEIENTTKKFSLGSKKQEHNLIDSLKIISQNFKRKNRKKTFYKY